eukprot:TRINITY_DN1943_c0_g1_i2.p1 TRINITY_DN1943_c0_g1~~TRINITY_DN1943_c0_g1_i2.p1  ORF type:complete len:248 (+),score=75.96 TRINITY_DN1943_c0_g1_i2:227-970(+)
MNIEDLEDIFNLDVALANLQSTTLDKKLKGLRTVKRMVVRATPKDDKRSFWSKARATAVTVGGVVAGVPEKNDKKEEEKPIDPNVVVEWLTENKVVEIIFSGNPHVEIIKQSVEVLIFLNKRKSLDQITTLDSLWDISKGRHESEKRVIFEAMATLAPELELQTIEHVFSRINEVELKDYDSETLTLLYDFTSIGTKASPNNYTTLTSPATSPNKQKGCWEGIEKLWEMIQDGTLKKPNLIKQALSK